MPARGPPPRPISPPLPAPALLLPAGALQEMSPSEVVATAVAFATMGREVYDSRLFDKITDFVVGHLSAFSDDMLRTLGAAYKGVNHRGRHPPMPGA